MSKRPDLRSYLWFSRWVFPRSYSAKFLTIAFVGIHLPLIGYVAYLSMKQGIMQSLPEVLIVLAATLLGTVVTLWSQYQLLAPVRLTAETLEAYRTRREIWDLPAGASDQAGRLMRSTRECLESLDQLMRLKDNLAAGIAHDFRIPLSGITLTTELLLDGPLNIEQRELIEAIRRTAEAQLRLVTGLLEAVLDDTRNARFEMAKVEVKELWEEVRATLGVVAAQRGVTLEFVPTDAIVAADAARITQVLNNLTSNALKATPRGGSVSLKAERTGSGWNLQVQDTGVGLDAQDILERLNSGRSAASNDKTKLGFGLRLSHSLLLLHASRLAVASQPGSGANFSFVLNSA